MERLQGGRALLPGRPAARRFARRGGRAPSRASVVAPVAARGVGEPGQSTYRSGGVGRDLHLNCEGADVAELQKQLGKSGFFTVDEAGCVPSPC